MIQTLSGICEFTIQRKKLRTVGGIHCKYGIALIGLSMKHDLFIISILYFQLQTCSCNSMELLLTEYIIDLSTLSIMLIHKYSTFQECTIWHLPNASNQSILLFEDSTTNPNCLSKTNNDKEQLRFIKIYHYNTSSNFSSFMHQKRYIVSSI